MEQEVSGADAMDQAIAIAKANYAEINQDQLELFLAKVFDCEVSILDSGGGAEKSGSSSGILIVTVLIGGETPREKKLVLRYDPKSENRLFFEYDLEIQYEILSKLSSSGLPLPEVYGIDRQGEILGTPGFVMECLPGEPIPTSLFSSGLLTETDEAGQLDIYRQILKTLVDIHALDYNAYGLGSLAKEADGQTPQEKLINWWWRTWEWARPEDYERLVPVRDWLLANVPDDQELVLMHGDPNLGNYLIHDGKISAVLDWELTSLGSVEHDIAIQIVSFGPHQLNADSLPVKPPSEELWLSLYEEMGGRKLGDLSYHKIHAAYQIIICLGSMCRYLPDDLAAAYQAQAEFYWALAENRGSQIAAEEIGAGIVAHSRSARFADTGENAWRDSLEVLLNAQPGITGGVTVVNVRQVGEAAGGSNGTLLFHADYETPAGLQSGDFVLRFLPAEGLFHQYDLVGQFNLQKALSQSTVPVPRQCWLDDAGQYLLRPGYVMEQVPGVSPPMVWKASGVIVDAGEAERAEMINSALDSLSQIHRVDWQSLGLEWLESRAKGDGPIERETNWYWDALLWSKHDDYIRCLQPVRDWLIANEPEISHPVLCHGDCNLGNYMFAGQRVSAVVDWEMAFLGTPECDLTFLEVGSEIVGDDIPIPAGVPDYSQMFRIYEELTGYQLQNLDYYRLFAAYRLAVINVLAMKHFPEEVLKVFMPTLEKGPSLCLARADALGVKVSEPLQTA